MKQLRNRAMRFKAAKEAEQGIGLIRFLMVRRH